MLARARAVTLTSYGEVARYAGLDPYVMLGRAGLHPSSLRDPENWLPANAILTLLDDSAARSGRDDFGILLGEFRTFASLGPVSLVLKHEATLRDAVDALMDYRRLLNDPLHFELREVGPAAVLEWNLVPGLKSTQGVSLVAAITYRVLVEEGAFDWRPDCVHFRQALPVHAATFKRFFRCGLEFESSFDGMSFSSACLDLPNLFADPNLAVHARRLLNLLPGIRPSDTILERARSTVPSLLCTGDAQLDNVARCLGVSSRTLQRRLISEGQTFGSLLNDVRRDLVVRYLTTSSHSVTDISHLVGYSTPSSFIRWFVSEFGMPPTKWRSLMKRRDELHLNVTGSEQESREAVKAG